MIFIALDIDGVLHSVDARTDADDPELKPFTSLHRFETVLRDYPDVRVVIASDWQNHHTLEELRALFSEDLRARIVGVTGRDLGDTQPGNRQRDVERYLTEQGLAEATWCAIDDDEQNYLPTTALVHCQNDGFREADERALRAVLNQLQESVPSPLLARATKALGSPQAAARWFATPQLALNKQRPLDLLGTAEGTTLVEDALVRIEYGVYT